MSIYLIKQWQFQSRDFGSLPVMFFRPNSRLPKSEVDDNVLWICTSTVSIIKISVAAIRKQPGAIIRIRYDTALGDNLSVDIKFWWVLNVLLHSTKICRPHQCRVIALWEFRRHLNFEVDFLDHIGCRIIMNPLDKLHPFGRQISLLAKTKHKDTRTGTNRSKE